MVGTVLQISRDQRYCEDCKLWCLDVVKGVCNACYIDRCKAEYTSPIEMCNCGGRLSHSDDCSSGLV